jgi:hypothetical protein
MEIFNMVALQHLMTYVPTYGVGAVSAGSAPTAGSPVLLMQCSFDAPTLAAGTFTVTFPETFPNGVVCVICTGGSLGASQVIVSTASTSGFSGTAYTNTGSTVSTSQHIGYIAIGF